MGAGGCDPIGGGGCGPAAGGGCGSVADAAGAAGGAGALGAAGGNLTAEGVPDYETVAAIWEEITGERPTEAEYNIAATGRYPDGLAAMVSLYNAVGGDALREAYGEALAFHDATGYNNAEEQTLGAKEFHSLLAVYNNPAAFDQEQDQYNTANDAYIPRMSAALGRAYG